MNHNKLIDGWRGVSVLCVIVGHYLSYRFPISELKPLHELLRHGPALELVQNIAYRVAAPIGETGVQFFFVISGYLITKLLAIEEAENGDVSLFAFYIRRIFRIMPAFYIYLLAVFALRFLNLLHLDNEAFQRSGAYICNVSGYKCSWWLAHTWSLSVEEQFYIVWPVLFVFSGSARRTRLILAILATLMLATFFFHDLVSFAHIAMGALIALSARCQKIVSSFATPITISLAGGILVFQPLLAPWTNTLGVIVCVTPLITAFVFFGTIQGIGPLGALVSLYPIRKLGLISYSVYLWQQLSTAPLYWGGVDTGAGVLYNSCPYFVWLFLVPAIISFFLIEKPMQTIGRKLSRRIIGQRIRELHHHAASR